MGLRVLDHLQPVLEAAQETIIVNQLRRGRGIDPAGSRKPAECLAGRADAQLLQSPAPYQLLRLGEELDLPNPPAAGLDVVPFHRDSSAAAVRVDLALDRVDVLDGCEVQVFPPDERLQLAQKASSGGAVAGDRTGLDQRGAFPVLPDALIVGERCRHRDGERCPCGMPAKATVGAERIAAAGVGSQHTDRAARRPRRAAPRVAIRRPRIPASLSSPRSSVFPIPAAMSSKSGSGPCSTRRVKKANSLTATPLRKGLLPKIDASRRLPAPAALHLRAGSEPGGPSLPARPTLPPPNPTVTLRRSAPLRAPYT